MDTFDTRKQAFENKYAHDKALDFNLQVLAIREIAKWVVEQMPDKLESSRHYADTLVHGPLVEKGLQAVITQIHADFEAHGHDIDPVLIIAKLEEAISSLKATAEEQDA